MSGAKGSVAQAARKLGEPQARALGLSLWDVEYVKEGSSWYLRYYIDKESGVTVEDCEAFSHAVDPLLDEADVTAGGSYFLEVSSPGVERELRRPEHFAWALGRKVRVRLTRPDPQTGARELTGELREAPAGAVVLTVDGAERNIPLNETAFVKIYDTYADMGGIE